VGCSQTSWTTWSASIPIATSTRSRSSTHTGAVIAQTTTGAGARGYRDAVGFVPSWPDPIVDDQGRGSFDTQAAGINTSSPQISAKIHDCDHVFPASVGIPWAP
jgi:hypothetical protein